jgi:hypothetical protein
MGKIIWDWWKKWAMVNVNLTLWMFVTVMPIAFLLELFL